MRKNTKIVNWRVAKSHSRIDRFGKPIGNDLCVVGEVMNSSIFENGDEIKTGRIVKVIGRTIVTEAGCRYLLVEINKIYRQWLTDVLFPYNGKKPLMVINNVQAS